MRRVLVVAAVAAVAVIAWLYWHQHQPVPLIVSGFIEADEIRVGSRVGGRVAEVLAREGQAVTAGQPLFRIDPFDLREKLAEADAELAALKAEHDRLTAGNRPEEVAEAKARRDQAAAVLAKLEAGPRPAEIKVAREDVNRAKANLELAESEHERLMKLGTGNQAAKTEMDEAVRKLKTSQADTAAAEAKLALLEEGTRKEDIDAAKASLAEAQQALALATQGYRKEDIARAAAKMAAAQAKVSAIRVQMQELTVVAPTECVVEAVELQPGELVAPNAPIISLLDLSRMWIRAYVPESRLGQVNLDQQVPIAVEGFPGERFTGRVTFISREAEFTPRNVQTPEERSKQVFRIKVTLEEGRDRLRVGMSADLHLAEGPQR